ncbi:MAG: hypothetical protein JW891_02325 [Candidatus Lokiarchaeota archaeon]|nr:hypothetical protein [Candidatus Lokiarchaeota archaeon]
MTRNIKIRSLSLIFILVFSFSLVCSVLSVNQANNGYNNNALGRDLDLKASFGALDPTDIEINGSAIYRHFQCLNISVNTTSIWGATVDNVDMEISFSNGTVSIFSMDDFISENYYSEIYSPGRNAPLGMQTVRFYAKNGSIILNDDNTTKSFWIKPNCEVTLDSPEGYYLDETVSGLITAINESMSTYDWNSWNVSIMDAQFSEKFALSGTSLEDFTFQINNTYFTDFNSYYYVAVELNKDDTTQKAISYFTFKLLNYNPEIDPSSISIPAEILRSNSDNAKIIVNVSDYEENPIYLNVSVAFQHDLFTSDLIPLLNNNGSGVFEGEFSIEYDLPIGDYVVNITARDSYGGIGCYVYSSYLSVLNNPPIIETYYINGAPASSGISIYYGTDIVFTFNISDVESDPLYVKVALVDPHNHWVNSTSEYAENMKIIVRTTDLVTGIWYIYIYVTDADGAVVSLTDDYGNAPSSLTIVPDLLSAVLPWIALVVGLLLGILVGFGIGYYKIKSKNGEPRVKGTLKKKLISQKSTKDVSSEVIDAQEPKKDEETKKTKTEPQEPEQRKTQQRKIKRKL